MKGYKANVKSAAAVMVTHAQKERERERERGGTELVQGIKKQNWLCTFTLQHPVMLKNHTTSQEGGKQGDWYTHSPSSIHFGKNFLPFSQSRSGSVQRQQHGKVVNKDHIHEGERAVALTTKPKQPG